MWEKREDRARGLFGLTGKVRPSNEHHHPTTTPIMKTPLKTTFRNLDHSDTLVARIQEEADKLDKCFDRITGCRVMVEMPHRHRRHGASFHVRIEVGVPGKQLVVAHDSTPHADGNDEPQGHQVRSPEAGETRKDVYVAIRDSFKVMRRQVEEYERTLRHDVKTHCAIPHARSESFS